MVRSGKTLSKSARKNVDKGGRKDGGGPGEICGGEETEASKTEETEIEKDNIAGAKAISQGDRKRRCERAEEEENRQTRQEKGKEIHRERAEVFQDSWRLHLMQKERENQRFRGSILCCTNTHKHRNIHYFKGNM